MKLAAFILLTSFISYLTETIKIPLSFTTSCKKTMSCTKMKEQCMQKQKANKSRKDNSQGCNSYCANCPLNCVTIFELYKSPFNLNPFYDKEYHPFKISILSDYIADRWKPPNNI